MKSIADLQKIREQARQTLEMRQAGERTQVTVYMGTCGIAAGARVAMAAIIDELSKENITDVEVLQRGCVGLCEQEPLVEVERPGEDTVMYGYVSEERARRIVKKHVMDGEVLDQWVINRGVSENK